MFYSRNQTRRNIITAVVEVIVTGVVLFLVYSIIVRKLGLQQLGGWSVLSAIAGAARIGEAGFAAAPARFVSKYRALGREETGSEYGQTAVIAVAALMILLLLLAAWPTIRVLEATVQSDILLELISLIPLAFLGTWLLSVASAVNSCIDGAERVDLRTYVQIFGACVYLIAVFFCVPRFGLIGLAWSQILHGFTLLIVGTITAIQIVRLPSPWKWRWSGAAFRDMFSYGINLQISSIGVALFEPVTKALLARFADLATVGLFEMVSRLVTQVKSLLSAANRALVPVYARVAEIQPRKGQQLFNDAFMVSLFVAVPVFGALVVFSPDIGSVWIGRPMQEFVWLAAIVCLGRLVNTLVAPAYFANLGQGHPAANAVGHVATAVTNLLFGLLAGILFGGIGVVWAYAVSVALGSAIIQIAFMKRNCLPISALSPNLPISILIGVSVVAGLTAASPSFLSGHLWVAQVVFSITAIFLLHWEYQKSPLFRRLLLKYGSDPKETV